MRKFRGGINLALTQYAERFVCADDVMSTYPASMLEDAPPKKLRMSSMYGEFGRKAKS